MEKKKLKLEKLKLKSFVTELAEGQQKDLKGGVAKQNVKTFTIGGDIRMPRT